MCRLSCFTFYNSEVNFRSRGLRRPISDTHCFIKDDTTKRDEKDFFNNNIADDAECKESCPWVQVFEIKKEENNYILDEKFFRLWSLKLSFTNYKLVPHNFLAYLPFYCNNGFSKESLCTVDYFLQHNVYAMAFKEYSRLCKDITKPVQDQDFETETQTTNAKLLGSSEKKLTSNVVI